MKKFQYRLETVLSYKNQVFDSLRQEYNVIEKKVQSEQNHIAGLEGNLKGYMGQLEKTKTAGAPIEEFRLLNLCIAKADDEIDAEKEKLRLLEVKRDKKMEEVLDAKIDTKRYEKLKDKRIEEYRADVQKEQEAFAEASVMGLMRMNPHNII